MLSDATGPNDYGRITEYLLPGTSIASVIDFVESRLPEFAQKYGYIENEKGLTNQLLNLLSLHTHRTNCLFRFVKDDPQNLLDGNSPTVDIGVQSNQSEGVTIDARHYENDETFFSFEAKRLTPHLAIKREKEYLIGRFENDGRYTDSGGVERFKKGIHGSKQNYGAMIGYVQKEDYGYWSAIINSWIDGLVQGNIASSVSWGKEEKLVEEYIGITARYKSINSRVYGGNIVIYHVWVIIDNNAIKKG